ncbi:hypothetical protein BKA56DRAFT_625972 [Ilyonectria sp. MPI-CAGE-AT-0026]|nr:hypothetical protein BKA56DRAFT_625972 [Ilyonectria sp. MPI-CAGE-AT-0026]
MGRRAIPVEERQRRQRERAKRRRQRVRQSTQARHMHDVANHPNIRLLTSQGRNESSSLHHPVPLASETTDTTIALSLPAQLHAPNHQGIGISNLVTGNNSNQAQLTHRLSHLSLSPIIHTPSAINNPTATTISPTAEIQADITAAPPLSPSPQPSQSNWSFTALDEHLPQGQPGTEYQPYKAFEETCL